MIKYLNNMKAFNQEKLDIFAMGVVLYILVVGK